MFVRSDCNLAFAKRGGKDQMSPHLDYGFGVSNGCIAIKLLKHVVDLRTR